MKWGSRRLPENENAITRNEGKWGAKGDEFGDFCVVLHVECAAPRGQVALQISHALRLCRGCCCKRRAECFWRGNGRAIRVRNFPGFWGIRLSRRPGARHWSGPRLVLPQRSGGQVRRNLAEREVSLTALRRRAVFLSSRRNFFLGRTGYWG